MDARSGDIVATIAQVSGADEVWYNPGDKHYYVAARNNPTGPVLGVIDARTDSWTQPRPGRPLACRSDRPLGTTSGHRPSRSRGSVPDASASQRTPRAR